MLGMLPERFKLTMVAEQPGPVESGQGPGGMAEAGIGEDRVYDLLLVPGGRGTRREVANARLIDWLGRQAQTAGIVATICTGAALLARTGLLDEHRATTNKLAFDWVATQGPGVNWQRQARWVEDGKYFTSSGISAGIDMSLAIIGQICGLEQAREVANWAEYVWNENSTVDPFA
jgi:transcriptional regulator GlxA family with amidase domain